MKRIFARMITALLVMSMVLCGVAMADAAPAQEQRLSVTTGLPTNKEYTPYCVQIDNAGGARPQVGIADADIIYEAEIANGGATRYTLLFNDYFPEEIMSVRSARMMHADFASDWNATLVHWGGQQMKGTDVYDYMSKNGITHVDGISADRSYFYRTDKRVSPHNVVCKLNSFVQAPEYARVAEVKAPLTFDADNYTRQGESVNLFQISYKKGYEPGYKYNAEDGLFYRYYEQEEQYDGGTGAQVAVANVIIMTAEYEYYNWEGDRPVVEMIGKNTCKFFIEGQWFEGYWQRDSLADATNYYDMDGREVVFKPGKTAIHIVRADKEIVIQ